MKFTDFYTWQPEPHLMSKLYEKIGTQYLTFLTSLKKINKKKNTSV